MWTLGSWGSCMTSWAVLLPVLRAGSLRVRAASLLLFRGLRAVYCVQYFPRRIQPSVCCACACRSRRSPSSGGVCAQVQRPTATGGWAGGWHGGRLARRCPVPCGQLGWASWYAERARTNVGGNWQWHRARLHGSCPDAACENKRCEPRARGSEPTTDARRASWLLCAGYFLNLIGSRQPAVALAPVAVGRGELLEFLICDEVLRQLAPPTLIGVYIQ